MTSVLTPSIFPKKIDDRESGETRISFKNPNSRSQITEIPMNIAVKSIAWQTSPGKINSW